MTRTLSMVVGVLVVLLIAGVVNAAVITALPEHLRFEGLVWTATMAIALAVAALWWIAVARGRR
ncbi:MAG: hypothetical protein AB7P22_15085 [Vicinamibacterales bacterium]